MKNFDLKTYGVSEMNAQECARAEGGLFMNIIVSLARAIVMEIIMNPSAAGAALVSGYEERSAFQNGI